MCLGKSTINKLSNLQKKHFRKRMHVIINLFFLKNLKKRFEILQQLNLSPVGCSQLL